MGYGTSTVQGAPVPDHNEKLANIWQASGKLADFYDLRVNMRFASMSDLTTKLTGAAAPVAGMMAYVADVAQVLVYAAGAWHKVYPTERGIYVGTTTPAANLGAVGDIYFQV